HTTMSISGTRPIELALVWEHLALLKNAGPMAAATCSPRKRAPGRKILELCAKRRSIRKSPISPRSCSVPRSTPQECRPNGLRNAWYRQSSPNPQEGAIHRISDTLVESQRCSFFCPEVATLNGGTAVVALVYPHTQFFNAIQDLKEISYPSHPMCAPVADAQLQSPSGTQTGVTNPAVLRNRDWLDLPSLRREFFRQHPCQRIVNSDPPGLKPT
ncbi:hypothetical protein C8J57DRAFT_1601824, partial [Mycena rebaudengoi]